MINEATDFFELMKVNPNLPIIPMVEVELCSDKHDYCIDSWGGNDRGYFMCNWGGAYIDEYLLGESCDKRILFKSENDVWGTLERYLTYDEFDALPKDEEGRKEIYNNLPWTRAIIVYITTC